MNHRQHLKLSAAKRHTLNIVGNPVWRALASAPMNDAKRTDIALSASSAFDDILHGRAKVDHLHTLACAANVALVLTERGYGPECEDKIIDSQHAILRAQARCKTGKGIGFDGPGAQAVRDLLSIYEQQNEHAGQVEVADALVEVRRRMASGLVMTDPQQRIAA